ncbi:MAG: cytochrome b/b6 domain-containing protein [Deltaproteobacteria bacterium]|nr:cytochrome b/b6 domain-containing protein [Deltaproteobacteria bacterium]
MKKYYEIDGDGKVHLLRFSTGQRVEHFFLMTVFIVLILTGFPQKYPFTEWARFIISGFGGINMVRWIHRTAGVLMALEAVYHISYLLVNVFFRKSQPTMLPVKKDITDALDMMKYCLGARRHPPEFDRYDYRQKFEYWGLFFGGLIMIFSGIILWYPIEVANMLPGELIPAAKVAHSNEALLALLVIIVWHIYGAHLNPDVFPIDKTIKTGKIDLKQALEEHPREVERLVKEGKVPEEFLKNNP